MGKLKFYHIERGNYYIVMEDKRSWFDRLFRVNKEIIRDPTKQELQEVAEMVKDGQMKEIPIGKMKSIPLQNKQKELENIYSAVQSL